MVKGLLANVTAFLGGRYYALTFNGTLSNVLQPHQLWFLTANPTLQFRYSFYDHCICTHFLPVTKAVNATLRLRAAYHSNVSGDGLQLGFAAWGRKVRNTCSTACSTTVHVCIQYETRFDAKRNSRDTMHRH